jgi:molecular chaperone HtpG
VFDYRSGVKLYVNRVFITDDDKELLPSWLRFVKGIIDSSDLPLNVSREILQQNRIMAKIRSNSVKKVLDKLNTIAKNKNKYSEFYNEFGRLIKEGVYQEFEHREALTELLRFKSTNADGYVSLQGYVERMETDQNSIYYITGHNEISLRESPLLEMYTEKNIEVLLLDDEIDEIIIPSVPKYDEKELKSVNRSGAADELAKDSDKDTLKEMIPLIKRIKKILGDKVKDVKISNRLSDSPSCIVADENDPTSQMQDGESLKRLDIFTSFTLSPKIFLILLIRGIISFKVSLSESFANSSAAPLRLTDFSSFSSYFGTDGMIISSISSSNKSTSIFFSVYISSNGDSRREISL